jgi:hypothetical protein
VTTSSTTPQSAPISALEPFDDPTEIVKATAPGVYPWVDRNGNPAGVPVVAFMNRAKTRQTTGKSELAPVIPMNDALNRIIVSMVMTGELHGFPIRYLLGLGLDTTKLTPGIFLRADDAISKEHQVLIGTLEAAQLVPFINEAEFLINQIATVSRTPLPTQMGGDNQSGEALKQREVGYLRKIGRYQVKGGNSWEDTVAVARDLKAAFGKEQPPKFKRSSTNWAPAEVRNDTEIVDNAIKVREDVGSKEFLRLIAPVYDYDEQDIERIEAEKQQQQSSTLEGVMSRMPNFGSFEETPLLPETAGVNGAGEPV